MKFFSKKKFFKYFSIEKVKNLVIFLLICFSIYTYLSIQKIKLHNDNLDQSINNIYIKLTPKPTLTPTPTRQPILSEYTYIALPHNGIVYSCKRSIENIIKDASLKLKKATEEQKNCFKTSQSKCNCNNDYKCLTNCTKTVITDCSKQYNEVNEKYQTIFNQNCIGGNNN